MAAIVDFTASDLTSEEFSVASIVAAGVFSAWAGRRLPFVCSVSGLVSISRITQDWLDRNLANEYLSNVAAGYLPYPPNFVPRCSPTAFHCRQTMNRTLQASMRD